MLRTPAFLGFSMVSRNNRRLLVATTYVILLVSMVVLIVILPSGRRPEAVWTCILLAYNVVSRLVFGRLVKDTVLPELRGGELTSLGLASGRVRQYEPDEREVAVRNTAHYKAYRLLAVYSIALWVVAPLYWSVTPSTAVHVIQLLTMPLMVMALTLPQAVVLWTEPDVPAEARVLT